MRHFTFRNCLTLLAMTVPLSWAGAASAQSVITSEETMVKLVASANPATPDAGITFTASVATTMGTGVPGGHIAFRDMTTMRLLGWTPVTKPSVTVADLSPGQHVIRADYTGTDSFLPLIVQPSQSEPLIETVLEKPQVTVSSSQAISAPGQTVTLIARVTSKAGTPTGTVTFRDGNSVLAEQVALDAQGKASFTTSVAGDGLGAIVAEYGGDARHAKAVSPQLGQNLATARSRDGT